ncbi:MAG: tetratricopeptide repeat protein [Bacteroidales bacterium]|nr:tetratricopeptide repeat protein [Bacteroidales bacterium]
MRTRIYILTLLMFSAAVSAYGQVDRKDVRKGNREFRKENYKEADIDYRKALVKDSLSLAANYNLANTLYRNGDMEQAKQVLDRIKDVAPASASAADYYFNAGDVAIARQDWQGAVEAFAKSLLINPGDLEAKENYIYAKEKLKDQQQNQQNQDQNQDQNDDQQNQNQNQDQQNKDQNKDRNQDQNDNQQDQNQDRKEQPQQGQQPKISPQAAQQMLQAIQAKEKETQDKVNRQKAEALKSRQKEKNW